MTEAEPKFSRKDIVISESPPGYDADPYPAIVLEVTDKTAGEQKSQYSDGTTTTLAEHYGEDVDESDPIYRIHDLILVDGELKKGTTEYLVPEGALRLRE